MSFGYVKVATYSPKLKVCDVNYNVSQIKHGVDLAVGVGAKIVAFPELCITGYTAGDLFYSKTLLDGALDGLNDVVEYTKGKNIIVFVGMPFMKDGLIYNVCVGAFDGKVLGIVPKSYLPNYSEFYEKRYESVAF